jgi:hypothetical protein
MDTKMVDKKEQEMAVVRAATKGGVVVGLMDG